MPTTVGVYSSFTLATCLCCVVSLIAHIIAYGTSKWLVSDGNSPFVEMGFHQACFVNCRHPYCPGGDPDRVYNRCYVWTFNPIIQNDEQYRELKDWLLPDWLNTANIVFIVNIPLLVVCSITLTIASCWSFRSRYKVTSTKKKDLALLIILYVTLAMLIVACLLSVTGIAIFSSNAPRRDYMPMAYRNSFGFSYWLELAVCILLGLCCVSTFVAAVAKTLHIQGPKDPRYAEDMMLGRM